MSFKRNNIAFKKLSKGQFNIKKVITFILTIILTISITACSREPVKNQYVSDDAFKQGKIALEVIDDFLQHNLDAKEAEEQLDAIYRKLDLIENNVDYFNDVSIKSNVNLASAYIRMKGNGDASYDDVEEYRNKLEEALYE